METKKYKDSYENSLKITRDHKGWRIAWHVYGLDDDGAYLGDSYNTNSSEDEIIACKVASTIAHGKDSTGFFFINMNSAKKALKAVNEALISGNILPDWAVKAKEAGWNPPDGWKP